MQWKTIENLIFDFVTTKTLGKRAFWPTFLPAKLDIHFVLPFKPFKPVPGHKETAPSRKSDEGKECRIGTSVPILCEMQQRLE